MSETERHGADEAHDYRCILEVKNGEQRWFCTADCLKWREAALWRREHLAGFMSAFSECTDVQTLRALAHRLGYKEGM